MMRELVLTFERDRWHASGPGVDVAHSELRGLEALIETRFAAEAPLDVLARNIDRYIAAARG